MLDAVCESESSSRSKSLPDKTSAIIIDMQPFFIENVSADEREQLIKTHLEVIPLLKKRKIPIVIVEYAGYGWTDQRILDSVGKDYRASRLSKKMLSAFSNPMLQIELKTRQSENLLLMGVHALWCYWETASDALKRGYRIYTGRHLTDGHEKSSYHWEHPHQWFKDNGVYVEDYRELFS